MRARQFSNKKVITATDLPLVRPFLSPSGNCSRDESSAMPRDDRRNFPLSSFVVRQPCRKIFVSTALWIRCKKSGKGVLKKGYYILFKTRIIWRHLESIVLGTSTQFKRMESNYEERDRERGKIMVQKIVLVAGNYFMLIKLL